MFFLKSKFSASNKICFSSNVNGDAIASALIVSSRLCFSSAFQFIIKPLFSNRDFKSLKISLLFTLDCGTTSLDIIDNLNHPELIKIEEAYYINERRWDLKFTNQMIVFLSEKNIETSLINYIKLIKQLKDSEILSVKSIDLRNNKKAIINFE